MSTHEVDEFGDIIATRDIDSDFRQIVLPRLWDFDQIEVRDGFITVRSDGLGTVVEGPLADADERAVSHLRLRWPES